MITFLGILLDGYHLILALPLEKKETAIELLLQIKSRRKTTVKELQKLCGLLNFVSHAVFPGRTFTRRMYLKFAGVINVGSATDTKQQFTSKLKQYHHVSLDAEFRSDCEIWLQFLQGDLQKVVNRPMVDLLGTLSTSEQVGFYSDASALEILGFGALLNTHWIQGDWETEFIRQVHPSIEYLELFALMAGILTWQDHELLVNCRITVFCDNMAVVHMINNMVSSCKNCMYLIRILTLNGLRYNRRLTATYVSSRNNFLSDALSRNQKDHFRTLGPHMAELLDSIPQDIWPLSKIMEILIFQDDTSL